MMSSIVHSKRKKPAFLFDNFRYEQDKIVTSSVD